MIRFSNIGTFFKITAIAAMMLFAACSKTNSESPSSPDSSIGSDSSEDDSGSISVIVEKKSSPCFSVSGNVEDCDDLDSSLARPKAYTSLEYQWVDDYRNNRRYGFMQIGSQLWTTENMVYEVSRVGSWCYDDTDGFCYDLGRLYSFYDAHFACPEGWHLPSADEWKAMLLQLGNPMEEDGNVYYKYAGTKLKDSTSWYGRDKGDGTFGFDAIAAGYRLPNNVADSTYLGLNETAVFWTSTGSSKKAQSVRIVNFDSYAVIENVNVNNGYGVRCVYDSTFSVDSSDVKIDE